MYSYHRNYYEKNKEHLREYQRAYYHRKKIIVVTKPKPKKILKMEKTYGKYTLIFD